LFEIPRPTTAGDASVAVSEAAFEALFAGLSTQVVH
jgi:transposase